MKKFFLLSLFLFFFISCSVQEELVPCESGHGYLYKDGKEFACPFYIQERITGDSGNKIWIDTKSNLMILDSSVGEYFPLKRQNAFYAYGLQIKVPKNVFTKERYNISLKAVDENLKSLGESRDVIFYRISENAEAAFYHTWVYGETYRDDYGARIFFAQKEMPSYDWYHVINVGTRQQGGFYIIGELAE